MSLPETSSAPRTITSSTAERPSGSFAHAVTSAAAKPKRANCKQRKSTRHISLARAGPSVSVFYVRSSVLALALFGCSSSLPHPTYTPQPQSALVEVAFPPPPARPEIVPDKPSDDAVWIDGEWAWRGRRWAWRSG